LPEDYKLTKTPVLAAAEGLPTVQTRRAFLKSAPLAAMAVSLPAVAVAVETESPMDRCHTLGNELAAALSQWENGAYSMEVFASNKPYGGVKTVWTTIGDPMANFRRMIDATKRSMSDAYPGQNIKRFGDLNKGFSSS
jgi:hypothetical protein